jgi:endonuclease/exonuclease/phosphatase family metal-dependent hydrolase
LRIASWNVQAIFDGTETGGEYEEYLSQAGWTKEKYLARLNALGDAVGNMSDYIPDVLALVEIENAGVLEDLSKGSLARYGFTHTFFANNPGNSLGLGILSRYPFESTRSHSMNNNGETTPRPILEVKISPGEKPLILFVCHWKSKLGGDEATESLRRSSARIIMRRLRELEKEEPGVPAVIMGDLNENHDEFFRQNGAMISALLPDDFRAAELTEAIGVQDFIILSGSKPPQARNFSSDRLSLYSPWGRELSDGSYYYHSAWETIDHFLLSAELFDKKDWDFDACEVVNKAPFVGASGHPASYNPRNGMGLSDHLPLLLTLKETAGKE